MRNLVLLKAARVAVQAPEVDDNPADDATHELAERQKGIPASAVTFDQASRRAYLLFPDGRLHAVDLSSGTVRRYMRGYRCTIWYANCGWNVPTDAVARHIACWSVAVGAVCDGERQCILCFL